LNDSKKQNNYLPHSNLVTKAIGLLIVVTVLFSTALFVKAEEAVSNLQEKIRNSEIEKERIEAEIQQYKKEIKEVGAEKNTLANKIKSLEITQRKLSADISLTENKIYSTNLDIAEIQKNIFQKEREIEENYTAISKTIRSMNVIEDISFLEILLTHQSVGEAWNEIGVLGQIQRGLQDRVEELAIIKDVYITDKNDEEEKKDELIGLQDELGDRKYVVDSNKSEQNTLLTRTKNKESEYKKILAEKERLREVYEQEIFDFQNQLEYLLDPSKLPSTGPGTLQYPVKDFWISQRFGKTVDSKKLYVSGSHSGVDFAVVRGSNIYAARGGVITATGNTDVGKCLSYGKWILLRHDNGLSTLYGHLDTISVSAGQSVNLGQVIGLSGNTGYSTGPHLHMSVIASDAIKVQKYANSRNCKNVTIPLANTKAYLDPLSYIE
jgi:murein DD-endopeptidase MepM/ murein hydrolase activator NlpD